MCSAGALALSFLIDCFVSKGSYAIYSIAGEWKEEVNTFALHRVRATFVPAQFRISVAKREGS